MASIALIGPGGAGKSTVGLALAKRLGLAFVDLDRQFEDRHGDISAYIRRRGYQVYARENVETYVVLLHDGPAPRVTALSSGFMTYARTVHPDYARIRREIEIGPMNFVLIPSLHREDCVRETVRRQCSRPFGRSASEEEDIIRERFPLYMALSAPKIDTNRPVDCIVEDVVRRVRAQVNGLTARRWSPESGRTPAPRRIGVERT